jgi:hypothetical protein
MPITLDEWIALQPSSVTVTRYSGLIAVGPADHLVAVDLLDRLADYTIDRRPSGVWFFRPIDAA